MGWGGNLHLITTCVLLNLQNMCFCAITCVPKCASRCFQEVAEPLQDLKEGMEQLEKNKTLRYILSTLLSFGNFLNSSSVSPQSGR